MFLITLFKGVKGLQDNLVDVFGCFVVDHKMLHAIAGQVINPLFLSLSLFLLIKQSNPPPKKNPKHTQQPNAMLPRTETDFLSSIVVSLVSKKSGGF